MALLFAFCMWKFGRDDRVSRKVACGGCDRNQVDYAENG